VEKGKGEKGCASEELIESILKVSAGRNYLSPAVTPLIVREIINPNSEDILNASPALSARERGALQMIAEGLTAREIANSLCISVKTFENHCKHTIEKTDLHTVAGLTQYAIRNRLTILDA
jgi:DNA-binding NarL/FixJ family response regulator